MANALCFDQRRPVLFSHAIFLSVQGLDCKERQVNSEFPDISENCNILNCQYIYI